MDVSRTLDRPRKPAPEILPGEQRYLGEPPRLMECREAKWKEDTLRAGGGRWVYSWKAAQR